MTTSQTAWGRCRLSVSLLLAGALMMSPPTLRAQDAGQPVLRLSVAEAIARAHQASQLLAEAQARQAGARAVVRQRAAADQPTLAVTGGYTRTNHVDEFGIRQPDGSLRIIYPDIPDVWRSRVFAQWPIYAGGRPDALERAAQAEAQAADADLAAARADLRLAVVHAYWRVATAAESVQVLEEALVRADAHLAAMRARLDAGFVAPNEVLSVEAERSRQELQLIEARNHHGVGVLELQRLVGAPAGTPLDLIDPLDGALGQPAAQDASTPSLIQDALQARPERQALASRLAGALDRQRAAHAGWRPAVNLGGGVDYARPNTRIFPLSREWRTSWDVGVNVTWTVWDSGRTAAEVAEAASAADAARARLAEFDSALTSDVRGRVLDLESARAAVQTAATGVRSAAEARRVVTERFDAGVVPGTDVTDAHVALLQAELERTRALANLRLAEARLERALGR